MSLDPLADLLDVLDLRRLGTAEVSLRGADGDDESAVGESTATVFVGRSQRQPHGRVFGGQVLAQSVVAAGRTVAELPEHDLRPRLLHSLHGYFLRPGDDSREIRFTVETLRDGRSFSTRRVYAIQQGAPILSMIASFQSEDDGLDHQDVMPDAPDPLTRPTAADRVGNIDHPSAKYLAFRRPIDVRHTGDDLYLAPARDYDAAQSVWLRAIGELPDDDLTHKAVLAYSSDYSLLEPVLRRHGLSWADRRLRPASLDHAMWFHRRARADEWILYTQSSPSASGGRGLCAGRMFAHDGRLVATVAQEGMIRVKEES